MSITWRGMKPVSSLLRRSSLVLLLGGLTAVAACSDEPEPESTPGTSAEYDGLSREQIESEASIMTIEEAESLGIVDTTIRVVPPMDPDSVEALENPIIPIDTAAQ